MRADGGMLTLHSSEGTIPSLMYSDWRLSDRERDAMMQRLTQTVRPEFDDNSCFWREGVGGANAAMMLMPIEQLEGHGRLVISILFSTVDEKVRDNAERLYRERKPFAIGFFRLWQQNRLLERRIRALGAAFDQTAFGVLLLSAQSQIVFENEAASEMLAAADGIARVNNVLRATNLADGITLQTVISHAAGQHSKRAPLLTLRRSAGPPLVAVLLPAGESADGRDDAAVVMYLVDPGGDIETMLQPLCHLYGLSTVESTLVSHLANGDTLAAAADRMHIREQTARSYLKTIFIKTGTKRQTQLISRLLLSVVRLKSNIAHEVIRPT